MPHHVCRRNRILSFNRFTRQPSRMNGKRTGKNTHPNDFFPGPNGHTRPVYFATVDDTGVRNPARMRQRQTKLRHQQRRENETSC